jgi:hypothetical protein
LFDCVYYANKFSLEGYQAVFVCAGELMNNKDEYRKGGKRLVDGS